MSHPTHATHPEAPHEITGISVSEQIKNTDSETLKLLTNDLFIQFQLPKNKHDKLLAYTALERIATIRGTTTGFQGIGLSINQQIELTKFQILNGQELQPVALH